MCNQRSKMFWNRIFGSESFAVKKCVGIRVGTRGTKAYWFNISQFFSVTPCWLHLQNNIFIYNHYHHTKNIFIKDVLL